MEEIIWKKRCRFDYINLLNSTDQKNYKLHLKRNIKLRKYWLHIWHINVKVNKGEKSKIPVQNWEEHKNRQFTKEEVQMTNSHKIIKTIF